MAKRSGGKSKPALVIGLAVITVAAVVGGLFWDSARGQASPSETASTYVPKVGTTPEPPPTRLAIADVMPRLADAARPFNVLVIGDSTGAARRGWVIQLAEAFGAKTGRETDLHQWSVEQEPDVYLAPYKIREGGPAPITFWNGSASGEGPSYSIARWGELAPVDGSTIDLVLINHGHNVKAGELGTAGKRLADKSAFSYPNAAVVTILQNPERPGAEHAAAHEENVVDLGERLKRTNFATIDVNTPYKTMAGWESAFDTPTGSLHPDQAGYDLWTGVVRQALGV